VRTSGPSTDEPEAAVETIIGKRVKTEDDQEVVVAIAHAGGGKGGWQVLMLTEKGTVTGSERAQRAGVRAPPARAG
jgi:hypothetical protein